MVPTHDQIQQMWPDLQISSDIRRLRRYLEHGDDPPDWEWETKSFRCDSGLLDYNVDGNNGGDNDNGILDVYSTCQN